MLRQKLAGGLNISASHNPPEYNGIKYTVGMGAGLTALPTVQTSLKVEQAPLFKAVGRKPLMNQRHQE